MCGGDSFNGPMGCEPRDDMTTTDETVKTRKKHQCRVCGQMILKGETVIRRAGFDSDGPWTIHMHKECEALTKDWDSMDWENISPGESKRPNAPSPSLKQSFPR